MRLAASRMLPTTAKVGAIQVITGAIAVGALFSGVSWQWWALAGFGYFMFACVGHSVGYHRYFAHNSFQAPRWAQVMFALCGTLGCVGSPAAWAIMHRRHHLYSDKEGDPYTAHRHRYLGWSALMLGEYRGDYPAIQLRRAFRRDPMQRFIHRYYFAIVGAFAGTLLAIDWRLFVFGWAVPVALTLWISALDAWATHHWGYRNYHTDDQSRNLWWLALLFWGEGWHNNHHAKPNRYSFRQKWWEIDVGAGVIWALRTICGRGPLLGEKQK